MGESVGEGGQLGEGENGNDKLIFAKCLPKFT